MGDPNGMGKGKKGKKGQRPPDKTGDNVTAAISIFIGVLFVGLIIGTMGKGWHYKMTHVWNFYIGIYSMEVNMDSLGGLALKTLAAGTDLAASKTVMRGKQSNFLSSLVRTFERGDHTIQHIRDQMCNSAVFTGGALGDMCGIWNRIMYASWGMLVAIALNVFLLLLGGGFCCLETTRCTRKFTYFCYILGLSIMGGAIAGYVFLTYELDNWLTNINLAVSLGMTFDKGFYACVFLTMCECLPPAVLLCCGTKMPTLEQEMIEAGKIDDPNAKGKGKGDMWKGGAPPAYGDPMMGGPPPGPQSWDGPAPDQGGWQGGPPPGPPDAGKGWDGSGGKGWDGSDGTTSQGFDAANMPQQPTGGEYQGGKGPDQQKW